MKGQNTTQTLKINRPPGTDKPQCACVRVCSHMHECKPENQIGDNLLSCKFRSADRDELPWTNTAALELQKRLAGSQRRCRSLLSTTFLWCKGCGARHVHWREVCARTGAKKIHRHIHNCCSSMYPDVTSRLASSLPSSAHLPLLFFIPRIACH